MNPISSSISSSAMASATAGATEAPVQQKKPLVSKEVKTIEQPAEKQEAPIDHENLKKLIAQANTQMAAAGNQYLSFGFEERLNLMYVQIKDNATGEVIREIPPKALIEQQAAMSEMIGLIIDRNA